MAFQFADGTRLTFFDNRSMQYVSRYTDGDRRDVLRPSKYQVDISCLFTLTNIGSNSFVLRADNGLYIRRHTITRTLWSPMFSTTQLLAENVLAAVEGNINNADRFSLVDVDGAGTVQLRIANGPPVWVDTRQKKGDALPWVGEFQVSNPKYLFLFASSSDAEGSPFKIEAPVFFHEVPGGARTDAPLCAVTLGNALYLIHKGGDGRVYLAKFDGKTWGQWSEVPGGATVNTPLSATVIGGVLYLATKGMGNDLYLTTSDGSNWSGWKQILGSAQTDVAPSISHGGSVPYLFYKGLDRGIYFSRYTNGTWSEPQSFPGGTDVSPTAVALDTTLHLFHTGRDQVVYFRAQEGEGWSGWIVFTSSTALPCALANSPHQKVFALTGTDHVVYTRTNTGEHWTELGPLPGPLQTDHSPTLAYLGTSCYLFYTGRDQKLYYSIVN